MQNRAMSSQNKRRVAGIATLLLLIALAGYWWASPLLAIRAMQVAAQRGDAEAFSEHVDYPSLRESLKGQLTALAAARLGAQAHGSQGLARVGAALGAALGMTLADPLVNALVQPEWVMRAIQDGKLLPWRGSEPPPSDSAATANGGGKPKIRWASEREGLDTFIAYAEPEAPGSEATTARRITLVLRRSGFATWKLAGIRLPD
jgi:hypothetical protein